MCRRFQVALLATAAALAAGEALATTVALLPVRRGVREVAVIELTERALADQVAARAEVVDPERTRAALRRLRLRAPDAASPERLRALAGELGADWLLSATVHDVTAEPASDLTVSARLYDGRSGRVAWAGAVGRSGLDRRKLLGLGVLTTFDELVPAAVGELLSPLFSAGKQGPQPPLPASPAGLGVVALVPFSASGSSEGVEVASTATESLRAVLSRRGVELAEPGCVTTALRGPAGVRWGELDAPARGVLRDACAAELLVTGAVERWELAGSGTAPEPIVAVALRLLDVASGKILWTGSLEAGGWDRQGWFGQGRVYSRGEQLRRLLERISRQMLAAGPAARAMKEAS